MPVTADNFSNSPSTGQQRTVSKVFSRFAIAVEGRKKFFSHSDCKGGSLRVFLRKSHFAITAFPRAAARDSDPLYRIAVMSGLNYSFKGLNIAGTQQRDKFSARGSPDCAVSVSRATSGVSCITRQ